MKRIVITGASSFIGKKLVWGALEQGWEVVAVVRRGCKKLQEIFPNSMLKVVELNMDEYKEIGRSTGLVDCFVHLSWNGTRGEQRNDINIQIDNYHNSIAAIESMLKAGCKKILTAGSQAEYGSHNGIFYESMMCNPNTEYGKYKLALFNCAKKLCEEYHALYMEPRFFSLYGPGDYEKTLIMTLMDDLQNNRECNLTQCTQFWDFLYIDEAVKAVLLLCEKDCEGGAYNIASGDIRRLKDYVEELKEILQSDSKLNYGVIPYPPSGMISIQPSIEKLQRNTGWKPQISFREGILKIQR